MPFYEKLRHKHNGFKKKYLMKIQKLLLYEREMSSYLGIGLAQTFSVCLFECFGVCDRGSAWTECLDPFQKHLTRFQKRSSN